MSSVREIATLGGGCFWCLDAVFREVEGVERVNSGYAGGDRPNPTYHEVCGGSTGHAEVVQVEFDPETIDFQGVLEIFFAAHDPTTLNRQGADAGTQYRSTIFVHDEGQRQVAEEIIRELEAAHVFDDPIVTQVADLEVYYPGESHHQDYFRQNPEEAYCQVVISPKLAAFRQRFTERLRR